MALSRVTRNYQVTIPAHIRKALHIQIGTLVDFVIRKGKVIIKPQALIDKNQAWFWTEEWQKGEREVDVATRKGRSKSFKNVRQMRRHFEK